MAILPISTGFLAGAAIVVFGFVAMIGMRRGALGVLRGHGGDARLEKLVRLHGNFIENAPLMVLALMVGERGGIEDTWLWLAITAFVFGRIYHALRYDHKDRGLGLMFTQVPMIALAVAALVV